MAKRLLCLALAEYKSQHRSSDEYDSRVAEYIAFNMGDVGDRKAVRREMEWMEGSGSRYRNLAQHLGHGIVMVLGTEQKERQ